MFLSYVADWATQHNLGRDVDVPQYLLEIVSPGLSSLLQSVRAGHATHPMLAVLEGLAALRRVWVQVCFAASTHALFSSGEKWQILF